MLYTFSDGCTNYESGPVHAKYVLGGKAAGLVRLTEMGFNVPMGAVATTDLCVKYMESSYNDRLALVDSISCEFENFIKTLPADSLYSVRSGAPVSMPGMMDTILNVGINEKNLPIFQKMLGEKQALDCYRRFLQMYGEIVLKMPVSTFVDTEKYIMRLKYNLSALPKNLSDLSVKHYLKWVELLKFRITKQGYVEDDGIILRTCIAAVFDSWMGERAIAYREQHGIDHNMGTAVIVQRMVFGNLNAKSCSGVMFTRDPNTGEDKVYGEYLINAQGEDVVAGTATPRKIDSLIVENPELYVSLCKVAEDFEYQFRDMQDVEFTVQDGELFILQTRTGKRSVEAKFVILHDMLKQGLIDFNDLKDRLDAKFFSGLGQKVIDPEFKVSPLVVGIAASGGVVTGKIAFSNAAALVDKGNTILVREATSPDDFVGMSASVGILTATGGETSHAAVVARSMGKACVCGAEGVSFHNSTVTIGTQIFSEGDLISIDGKTGRVWSGTVPVTTGVNNEKVSKLISMLLGKVDRAIELQMSSYKSVDEAMCEARILDRDVHLVLSEEECTQVPEVVREWDKMESSRNLLVKIEKRVFDVDAMFYSLLGLSGGVCKVDWSNLSKELGEVASDRVAFHVEEDVDAKLRGVLESSSMTIVRKAVSVDDLCTGGVVCGFSDSLKDAMASLGMKDIQAFLNLLKKPSKMLPEAVSLDKLLSEVLSQ